MAATTRENVKNLCKSILTRLENQNSIAVIADSREQARTELFEIVGAHILTEEDLHLQTLEKIGMREEELGTENFTENTQYRTAKSMVRKTFGDDQLNGFYFQKNLKEIAQLVSKHFMSSASIDEVYESDEELEQAVVDIMRRYNPANSH